METAFSHASTSVVVLTILRNFNASFAFIGRFVKAISFMDLEWSDWMAEAKLV